MATASNDPWVDNDTKVDFTPHAEDRELAALAATAPIDEPTYDPKDFEVDEVPGESLQEYLKRVESGKPDEVLTPAPKQAEPVEPAQADPAPEASKAEVHQYPDGSSLSVEKTSKGWKAVCDTGIDGVKPEVFYGATKDEMWQNVAAGKINATKKIREQNKRMKLEAEIAVQPAPAPAPQSAERDLTADEIFEITTQLQSNPDLAFSTWFQKKAGMSLGELLKLIKKGATAADELDAEQEVKEFLSQHPDYWAGSVDNRFNMGARLSAKFLRVTMTQKNQLELEDRLIREGYWTAQNLGDAYDDLNESGLLEFAAAAAPEPVPAPKPTPRAAAPAAVTEEEEAETPPASERIVRTVRRPRAGLGLSSKETVTVPKTSTEKPPSAEDLDNLSDSELDALYNSVRRSRLTSRR